MPPTDTTAKPLPLYETTPKDLREGLMRVRECVGQAWTQAGYMRLDDNNVVDPNNPNAVCGCLEGAMLRSVGPVGGSRYQHPVFRQEEVALKNELPTGFLDIVTFNDAPGRTQSEVLALVDKAIAALDGAGEESK